MSHTSRAMVSLISTERVVATSKTSATEGRIVWSPVKSLWLFAHVGLGFIAIFWFPQIDAFLLFVGLTAMTVCAGHSVGMHRLLIHRSFQTHTFLEYFMVWLGTLVGMAGPIGMIKAHDMRDWHQRQRVCPPHPAHGASFWKDAWWQLCCTFELVSPPTFIVEERVREDLFYIWLERTWMLQQIPVACLLFVLGGWSWVLWGCSLRIAVSLIGHWMVGHYAHRAGHQGWVVKGLPVQGYNLRYLGLLTFGENWHCNHHAFPHSAKLGVEKGQLDLGFALIQFLQRYRLVWEVKTPASEPTREGLARA
ncbi:acyl-CoA desaturase [uncultured Roseobacter sp.]|uniref:acyl-CoA desaturase n=1 Tax=uncultured Roseobacter sp. TaxID=114847 RepID=UPI0026188926|nr:acyl-CoA desaturase [uncultured Roseobacter sp.]